MLDAIKEKCTENGALAAEWRSTYDELKQDYSKEMLSLNAPIHMQGQEEALLQSQLLCKTG
eukprot:8165737-Prorocentrum_lima.AAC.1